MKRYLGNYEKLSYHIDKIVPHTPVIALKMKGILDKIILKRSLLILKDNYSILNARIVIRDEKIFLEEDKRILFNPILIDRYKKISISEEIKNSISFSLNNEKKYESLARMIYIENLEKNECLLIFSYHHMIGDGISSVGLMKLLIDVINKSNNINLCNHEIPKPIENLLSIEDFIENRESLNGKSNFRDSILNEISTRKTGFVSRRLSRRLTKSILSRAKKRGVTVNSAICSAILIANSKFSFPKNKKSDEVEIGMTCPVNMRNFCQEKLNEYDMGYLVSWIDTIHKRVGGFEYWELTSEINKMIHDDIRAGNPVKRVKEFFKIPYLINKKVKIIDLIGLTDPHVCITNIGIIDIPSLCGKAEIEEVHFALNAHGFCLSENNFIALISTFKEIITIDICYPVPLISEKKTNSLADYILRELKSKFLDQDD